MFEWIGASGTMGPESGISLIKEKLCLRNMFIPSFRSYGPKRKKEEGIEMFNSGTVPFSLGSIPSLGPRRIS